LCIASLLRRHSAAVVRECFQRSTSTNSQPTQRSLGPFLEFISTITLVPITLSFFTVLCAILSQKLSTHQSHQTHNHLHMMKSTTVALLALTAGSTSAQFFVLYGRDTVVSRIDPIVSPGGIGMHAHEFMGAGNIDQNSDYDSLQKSTCSSVGRANGNPIIEDKSAYWHPTLYVKANNGTYLRVPVSLTNLRMMITLLTTILDQWSPDLLHQCRHWPDARAFRVPQGLPHDCWKRLYPCRARTHSY
jgi:hypothetical protein